MEARVSASPEALEHLCLKDPILGAFIQNTGLLSREMTSDPYKATLECIIAQQVSGKAAISITERFYARFPDADPKAILQAPLEALRACGLSGSKAAYLRNIAQVKADGSVDFEHLKDLSTPEIMEKLLPIKGVGRWTVEMVLIFSLGKPDVMSYDDLAIRRGIERLYHKRKVTKEFFAKLYRRYAPYQTIASLYLWDASLYKEAIPFPKTDRT